METISTENLDKIGLVDTNLFIYAHNADSAYYKKARRFLKKLIKGNNLCLTPQVLLESFRILTQKMEKPIDEEEAWRLLDAYLNDQTRMVYPTPKALLMAKDFSKKYRIKGAKIFDAYLVATIVENGVDTIYTHNEKDFLVFREIRAVNPLD